MATSVGLACVFSGWLGDCAFWRPSSAQPAKDTPEFNAKASRPLFSSQCFPECRYGLSGSPVHGLLLAGSPSAVSRLIVAVVVDALNRVIPRRSIAHVSEEGMEVDAPSLTHLNAAASITMETRYFGIVAALFHAAPCRVFNGRWASSHVANAITGVVA